jgi:streptogramin lyase
MLCWPLHRRVPRATARSAKSSVRFWRPRLECLEDRCAPALITEFPALTGGSQPTGITIGPDGNLWFTEINANKIGRITPSGTVSEFTVPTANSLPTNIAVGADGNLWFTEQGANKIGRITTAGVFTGEFAAPGQPRDLTTGPDGNLWFTQSSNSSIARMTLSGAISEFNVPSSFSAPNSITTGPDGNFWITERNANKIGRLTPTGTFTEFTIPTAGSVPIGLTAGPDGNVWFAESFAHKIGRITPTGTITEFSVDTHNAFTITAGSDGNLWFTENGNNNIGRITPAGVVTEFAIPTAGSGPSNITAGPDGNIWFTEQNSNKIGRLTVQPPIVEFGGLSAGSFPRGITAGPDGNLWFAEENGNRIGRITPAGVVTEFSAGITAGTFPEGITAGADGNLWFAEQVGDRIGRITPAGVVTEFNTTAGSHLFDVTAGPDGNIWFTEVNGNRIGRITPAGVVTEFSAGITAGSLPEDITAGPDGNLWFTQLNTDEIGRITPAGVVTEFTSGITSSPAWITAGPDGNLWFTLPNTNQIGRITPAGVVTEFTAGITSDPEVIRVGPDGNLWFTETLGNNQIGRITPAGVVTEFSTGITAGSHPIYITAGPDGNMWFTEESSDRIGRLSVVTVKPAILDPGTVNASYGQSIAALGGTDTGFTYSLIGAQIGDLPTGLRLTSTGLLTGTPQASGIFQFMVIATDSLGHSGAQIYSLTINPGIALGPATLPVAALGAPPTNLALAIDAGGPAAGSFVADADFSGGIQSGAFTATIDTSGVTNPAPQTVYQTERFGGAGDFTYSIPGLAPGITYAVRLHFAEDFWSAAGQRVFNVSINGTQVLSNFDIFVAAGGMNKAIVETFNATADASGQITIQFTNTTTDFAKINGIEIEAGYSQQLTATGGSGAGYTFSEIGTLPPGLSLSSSGLLSGTPTALGTYSITVIATDSNGASGSQPYLLTVADPPLTYSGFRVPPLPPGLRFTYRRILGVGFGPFQITSNSGGTSTGTGFDGEEVTGIPPLLNPTAEANVIVGSSQAAGLMARVQPDGSAYVAVLTSTGQAQIWLLNAITGTRNVLAVSPSSKGSITSGTLQFVVDGSSLALYLLGNPAPLVAVMDPTLTTAGGVGIFAWGPGGIVNNFVVDGL